MLGRVDKKGRVWERESSDLYWELVGHWDKKTGFTPINKDVWKRWDVVKGWPVTKKRDNDGHLEDFSCCTDLELIPKKDKNAPVSPDWLG